MGLYPQHEREEAVSKQLAIVKDFTDWLHAHGYEICQWVESDKGEPSGFFVDGIIVERLIAEWQGIDYPALQAEKDDMYQAMRQHWISSRAVSRHMGPLDNPDKPGKPDSDPR